VGYAVTADNFFKMPDNIWLGIYKKGYWDEVKGDSYTSQALANAIVDYAWAFGVGGARTRISKYILDKYKVNTKNFTEIANAFNTLTKNGDKQVFDDFIEHRKQAFKALKQPANEKGWLTRMDTLRRDSLSLLYDGVTQAATKVTTEVKKNPC
jgi:lysozyme family protein